MAINTAHELGHKRPLWERRLALLALGPVAYGHFHVEHNRGHHRRVATPEDPASARLRAFPHRANPAKGRIGARTGPFDWEAAEQWQREGRGIYLVHNARGDRKSELTDWRGSCVELEHGENDLPANAVQGGGPAGAGGGGGAGAGGYGRCRRRWYKSRHGIGFDRSPPR